MKYLLDTHALLWWLTDDPRLSGAARKVMGDENNPIYVSAASAWEMATKQRIGKLPDIPAIDSWYAELIAADGFQHLPVNHLHSIRAGSYEVEHRDPFDRMLAAQSELESLTLVSRDPAMEPFGCALLW